MHLRFCLVALLLLSGCAATTSSSAASGSPSGHAPVRQEARLARLVTASIPARNLYALTDQLKLRPPRPIAHVIRTVSPNYPVGHQDSFYVLSEDKNHYFVMHAKIVAETPHLYIYVQNGENLNRTQVQAAANTFENHIYPTDRAHFGSEWTPGVDGDPHITCLVGNLLSSGAGGFYSAEDEYPRIVNPYSNQREMIYINSIATVPGDQSFNLTLSHEFQHMIHWHMHPHDNAWLNEGMSMLAEDINNYPPGDEVSAYLDLPDTQLNTWSLNGLSSAAHYGAAYLFLAYLYDRLGSGFIRAMLADSRYTDFALINDVLHKRHINTTANALFTQWVVANQLRDPSVDGGVYAYRQMTASPSLKRQFSLPFSTLDHIHPYAAQYLALDHLSGRKTVHLTFSAPTTIPLLHLTRSGPFWWSNRGDMSETTLERTVDLRHVRQATLHFRADYDIEKDYDYAYVEVSRDGGKTWTTLRGTDTTTSNPNGASYGNAYTGRSKTERAETMNLSPYAGHKILLRFQYVTDDEYTGEGIVFKDISIPAIGFHDTFTGWKTQGFVPVAQNVLADTWHVQLIEYRGTGAAVVNMPIHGGRGSLTIAPSAAGITKVIAVVFDAAPKTTVLSTYHLSAR
jgi:immune inhibitor A